MLLVAALAVLATGCGSAKRDALTLTRDDGSEFAVNGAAHVSCERANGDGPPALQVMVGKRDPAHPKPFWVVQVPLRELKRGRTFTFPHEDAIFFAFDAARGRNELSSADAEDASGRMTFTKADCHDGVAFRIDAHLGSEFFDEPGADVKGRFATP
jgi:hypothetical protein